MRHDPTTWRLHAWGLTKEEEKEKGWPRKDPRGIATEPGGRGRRCCLTGSFRCATRTTSGEVSLCKCPHHCRPARLTVVKGVNFMLGVFYHNKQRRTKDVHRVLFLTAPHWKRTKRPSADAQSMSARRVHPAPGLNLIERSHTPGDTLCNSIYDILEQAKPTYDDRHQNSSGLWGQW